MHELRRSLRVAFVGSEGRTLSGILDQPIDEPKGLAIFSHCFTCSKDLKAIVRISRRLAEHGWGVLRYDFAGLGSSEGEFASTNFTTNRADLLAAARFLAEHHMAPKLLIGHSFGGAASLSVAGEIPSVLGVVAVAAPSDTQHLADLLVRMDRRIETDGEGVVTIGGIQHRILRQMIDDFRRQDLPRTISQLTKPVLVFHSPDDETLGFDHALRIFSWVMQRSDALPESPGASLIALPGADHLLLKNPADLRMVSDAIHVWLTRLTTPHS